MSGRPGSSLCEQNMGGCLAGLTDGVCHLGVGFKVSGGDVVCLGANPGGCADRQLNSEGRACVQMNACQFTRSEMKRVETEECLLGGAPFKFGPRKKFFRGQDGVTCTIVQSVICLGTDHEKCREKRERAARDAANVAALQSDSSCNQPTAPT